MHTPAEEEPINDPGNEDPGSLMDDAQVPLIEQDDLAEEGVADALMLSVSGGTSSTSGPRTARGKRVACRREGRYCGSGYRYH